MDDVKRLGTPLLIIVLSAFLTKLVETWLKGGFVHTLLIIIMVASLFMFGVSLNRKKRSNAVFRKVVAIVIVLLLLFMQLGYLDLAIVNRWFAYLGMGSFTSICYIYSAAICSWIRRRLCLDFLLIKQWRK